MQAIRRFFKIDEAGSTIATEIRAGVVTFMTMAYIVVVQPAVLMEAGMPVGGVMLATCIASAVGTLLMALLANYPIALAPAMGHNFYFAFLVTSGQARGSRPWARCSSRERCSSSSLFGASASGSCEPSPTA